MVKATGSKYKRDIQRPILDKLQYRFSPFKFQQKALDDLHLSNMFEAARWTPSAKNLQPWSFLYTENGATSFDQLLNCLTEKNKRWAKDAPILMLCIYNCHDEQGNDNFYALHDLGSAVANMTLQAQEDGVAIHLMGGKETQQAKEIFNLPAKYHVSCIAAIGYYCLEDVTISEDYKEEAANSHKRKSRDTFVFKDSIRF